jgi:hypothetical protein
MSTYNPEKPWLGRVLIPFWLLQLLFSIILLGFSIWAVRVVDEFNQLTGYQIFS